MLPVGSLQKQAFRTEANTGRTTVGVVAAKTRDDMAMRFGQNERDDADAKDIHLIVVSFSSVHFRSYGTIHDGHKPV